MTLTVRGFKFLRDIDGGIDNNLALDGKIALLASCVADQQKAGFGNVLDLRQAECPQCRAPGFNTGWGYWAHTCGAEIIGGEDPQFSEPCGAKRKDKVHA